MTESAWLAIVSVLLTVVGALFMLGYREISRRLGKLERQDEKLFAAILTLLVAKDSDHDAIARALHSLLINGVEHKIGG
jgi:hypothetical protein